MTGIIHFDDLGRVRPKVSRRTVLAGGAAAALSAAFGAKVIAQTPDASPVTQGGTFMTDARDRLRALLSWMPGDVMDSAGSGGELFTWVDFQQQFAALGVNDPFAEDTDLAASTMPLMTSDPLLPYAMAEDVRGILGFSIFEVQQVLTLGMPPDRVQVYAGGVPFSDLAGTWEAAGYERKSADWGEYWTIGENGEMDIQRGTPLGIGVLNNIAQLDDSVVVIARTLALLEQVVTHEAGAGGSAADDDRVAQLIDAMPQDAVNAIAFAGEVFRADAIVPENPGMESFTTAEELLAESDDAVGPMPRLLSSLCGVTAGAMTPRLPEDGGAPEAQGNPDATAFMSFLTTTEDQAAAAAEVAYWRLGNMQSFTTGQVYRERFVPVGSVEDAVDGQVMTVTFDRSVADTGAWATMVMSRDTWPFAWVGPM